jgi:hypothetical protein
MTLQIWCRTEGWRPCSVNELKSPWPYSARELYRPSDRRLSAKLVPIFAGAVIDDYSSILKKTAAFPCKHWQISTVLKVYSFIFTMETWGSSGTPETTYQIALCYIADDSNLHKYRLWECRKYMYTNLDIRDILTRVAIGDALEGRDSFPQRLEGFCGPLRPSNGCRVLSLLGSKAAGP